MQRDSYRNERRPHIFDEYFIYYMARCGGLAWLCHLVPARHLHRRRGHRSSTCSTLLRYYRLTHSTTFQYHTLLISLSITTGRNSLDAGQSVVPSVRIYWCVRWLFLCRALLTRSAAPARPCCHELDEESVPPREAGE